jgi:glycerophosphoryl diester phosphodiesterase
MVGVTDLATRPLLYAHRGAAAERPENTMISFARALELGADALELDVHLSADGVVVVSHDASALRMAGVPALFCRAQRADIRRWDAGHGFLDPAGGRPFAGRGVSVPTLEEVLMEFSGVPLNVDIKQHDPPMVPQLLALLRRLRATERVRLASFRRATLRQVRAAGYEGPTGLAQAEVATLVLGPRIALRRRAHPLDAAQLPLRYGVIAFDTPRIVARCRRVGLRLDYWTVNHPAQAERLLALGADGIISDDPGAIVGVIAAARGE